MYIGDLICQKIDSISENDLPIIEATARGIKRFPLIENYV